MPSADQIALLRRDIDRKPHRIKGVLTNARIRRRIFNNIPNDEKKAVDEFAEMNHHNALKTRPNVGVLFPWSNLASVHNAITDPFHHRCLFAIVVCCSPRFLFRKYVGHKNGLVRNQSNGSKRKSPLCDAVDLISNRPDMLVSLSSKLNLSPDELP